jgi:hypothetical protein
MDKTNGDNFLSPFEFGLWSIQQEIIFRWGVFTIFRWDRINVPKGKREAIWWFVPRDEPDCYEICQWLEKEVGHNEREDTQMEDIVYPGLDVYIKPLEFSGIDPHMEREEVEKLARKLHQRLIDAVKKKKGGD